MGVSDLVRVTIIGPDSHPIYHRDVVDSWYRLGGHQHPNDQQQVRDACAAEELREWLRRWTPLLSGDYVAWVAEVHPTTRVPLATWANTKVKYTAPRDRRVEP